MPESSDFKMDPLEDMAEPVSQTSVTCGSTFRKGQKKPRMGRDFRKR